MRYLSVCSGIEAASLAWHGDPLNWTPVAFAEVDPQASAVLRYRYPGVRNLGDFTAIRNAWLRRIGIRRGAVELLVGGSPCQSFSVAGLRGGLDDHRGNLALEFLRLARRIRPRWVVWENVPGVLSVDRGRAFGAFLGALGQLGYGFAYRILDAQYAGVPQRRRRVFVVGHLGDWRRAAAVLFERHSMSGDPPPVRGAGQEIAAGLEASLGRRNGMPDCGSREGTLISGTITRKYGDQCGRDLERSDMVVAHSVGTSPYADRDCEHGKLVAFGGNNTSGPIDVATACNAHGGPHGRLDFETETFVATVFDPNQVTHGENRSNPKPGAPCHTLPAMSNSPVVAFQSSQSGMREVDVHATLDANNGSRRHNGVVQSGVRRLMPIECERLQGLPDDWTLVPYRGKPMADGPRYKMIGNSFAVPCVSWIGERIQMVEDLRV